MLFSEQSVVSGCALPWSNPVLKLARVYLCFPGSSRASVSIALQQAHLLESLGHSRQPSDSSVERFVPREDAAESYELETKVSVLGQRPAALSSGMGSHRAALSLVRHWLTPCFVPVLSWCVHVKSRFRDLTLIAVVQRHEARLCRFAALTHILSFISLPTTVSQTLEPPSSFLSTTCWSPRDCMRVGEVTQDLAFCADLYPLCSVLRLHVCISRTQLHFSKTDCAVGGGLHSMWPFVWRWTRVLMML